MNRAAGGRHGCCHGPGAWTRSASCGVIGAERLRIRVSSQGRYGVLPQNEIFFDHRLSAISVGNRRLTPGFYISNERSAALIHLLTMSAALLAESPVNSGTNKSTFLIAAASGCSSLGWTCHSRFFHLAMVVK